MTDEKAAYVTDPCTCGKFVCRAGRRLCNDEPWQPFTALVSEIATFEVPIDVSSSEWEWLHRYPRDEWPKLIQQSASETDGTLDRACNTYTATGAWREVNLP